MADARRVENCALTSHPECSGQACFSSTWSVGRKTAHLLPIPNAFDAR